MRMTVAKLFIGAFLVYWASAFTMVILPVLTINQKPSAIWLPINEKQEQGHKLYVKNGCSYCHSLFIRTNDWGLGAERIAETGDYAGQQPAIWGTERTGPDLSQEGGEHPDDWHMAHFVNPRYTSPHSLMPNWKFLGKEEIEQLTAYVQYLGGTMARVRVERQVLWKQGEAAARQQGVDSNIVWLHKRVPDVWLNMPNPYPPSDAALLRGKRMYEHFCVGCHGLVGDGQGPAAIYLNPVPLNFTTLRRHLIDGKYIGGLFYYQIMNGITGTAMPYFKRALESEKIWDIGNYVAVSFVGYSDAEIAPHGIDAAYEMPYKNPYQPPGLMRPLNIDPSWGRDSLPLPLRKSDTLNSPQ